MNALNELHEIEIKPPESHSKKQEFIYQSLSYPGIREIWICAGTKFGKTISSSVAQIVYAMSKPDTVHRWIAPIYSQTRQPKAYFRKILPGKPDTLENKSDNSITLPGQNIRFEFWHGQNPSSLEGDGIHSYVVDEAAKQTAQVHASARTTVTKTKGPMIFISYPFGKNWFYDKCMEAKESMEWCFKNNKPYEKLFIHARTIENKYIDPQVVENAKKEMPWRLYQQYYLAEFIGDGTVFSGYSDCVFGDPLDISGDVKSWYAENAIHCVVTVGADWAKTIDFSCFTAFDIATKKLVGFMHFHRRPYTEQVRMLSFFCRKFMRVEMILHDKTGVGEAIDDMMAYINQPYRGITWNNALKSEYVLKLITGFEQSDLSIPNWSLALDELKSYECKTNSIGTVSYNAQAGKHDDIVMSLVLGYYGSIMYSDHSLEIKYLDDLQKESQADKTELEKYYNELIDDDL